MNGAVLWSKESKVQLISIHKAENLRGLLMTIIESAIEVLRSEKRPMLAEEIYRVICSKGLFKFGAKDPISVLRAELRRHSTGFTGKTKSAIARLKQDENKHFTVID
jgi:restriction system protein